MCLGQGLQGLSQLVWMKCCHLGNRSRSHGRYLRQALPLCLSWYSYFFILVLTWKNEELYVCLCLKAKHENLTWPCFTLLYTKGKSFNSMIDFSKSQTIQKVTQILAPLALFLIHVIALATGPPSITSWLNDRLIHLWVWVVKLAKVLSPLLMQEMWVPKVMCKETVQKIRWSISFYCTNCSLGLFVKSVAKWQAILAFYTSYITVWSILWMGSQH